MISFNKWKICFYPRSCGILCNKNLQTILWKLLKYSFLFVTHFKKSSLTFDAFLGHRSLFSSVISPATNKLPKLEKKRNAFFNMVGSLFSIGLFYYGKTACILSADNVTVCCERQVEGSNLNQNYLAQVIMFSLLFRSLKIGRNFVFGCVLVFFIFHEKSGSTNTNWTGLSDISF